MTPQEELRRIADEIRDYPRPIAGCDAQFNYLLERRAALEDRLQEEERSSCS